MGQLMSRTLSLAVLCCATLFLATACGTFTRTEKDVYTITRVDTTVASMVQNQPMDRDHGVIYPSSRTVEITRNVTQRDSTVTREYPDFIRVALFESVGMIGSKQDGESLQAGMFGIHGPMDRLLFNVQPDTTTSIFTGAMYRIGVVERKLWLFDSASNWTWGFTTFEMIRPDDNPANTLRGVFAPSISKRFYFRDKIPYFAFTPTIRLSAFPSIYGNASVSADIGSIGGVTLRAHVGYVFGQTSYAEGKSVNFGYAGMGVGIMDFLNREEELYVEWKDHEHSAWDISIAQFTFVGSSEETSAFNPTSTEKSLLKGFIGNVGTADIALPWLDYHITAGTTLFSMIALGAESFGIGVLPLRVGGVLPVGEGGAAFRAFIEYSYLPASWFHTGVKFTMLMSDLVTLHATLGYVTGDNGSEVGYNIAGDVTGVTKISGVYFGFGAGIFDWLFTRDQLRYGKNLPHE
jgi:hypothetical protein